MDIRNLFLRSSIKTSGRIGSRGHIISGAPVPYAHPWILAVGKGDPFTGVSVPFRLSI